MLRVFLRQGIKHQVDRVLKILLILAGFHGIDEVYQRGEILLLRRRNVMQIANQRRVQKRFAFDPEILTAFSFAFGIRYKCCYQFENILF